jgi:hypothetical protein
MLGDLDELLEFKLEIGFGSASKVATTPSSTFSVCDWTANSPSRGEKEKVDVRVDL